MRSLFAALLSFVVVLHASALPRPAEAPDTDRWAESLAEFDQADRLAPPRTGGVVFVGSSTIRMWDGLESSFGDKWPVIVKRGFGGSHMTDCTQNLQRLVTRHQPRLVVVYAGENDLNEGRAPTEVLESFRSFVEGVQRALPDTRIVYLSIKPSPARTAILPLAQETNRLIERYTEGRPRLGYIDIHSAMLGPDGQPRAELFLADRIHMNSAGYQLWRDIIATRL